MQELQGLLCGSISKQKIETNRLDGCEFDNPQMWIVYAETSRSYNAAVSLFENGKCAYNGRIKIQLSKDAFLGILTFCNAYRDA